MRGIEHAAECSMHIEASVEDGADACFDFGRRARVRGDERDGKEKRLKYKYYCTVFSRIMSVTRIMMKRDKLFPFKRFIS